MNELTTRIHDMMKLLLEEKVPDRLHWVVAALALSSGATGVDTEPAAGRFVPLCTIRVGAVDKISRSIDGVVSALHLYAPLW